MSTISTHSCCADARILCVWRFASRGWFTACLPMPTCEVLTGNTMYCGSGNVGKAPSESEGSQRIDWRELLMGNQKAKVADRGQAKGESSSQVPPSPMLRDEPQGQGNSRKRPADSDLSQGKKSDRDRQSVELFKPVSDVHYICCSNIYPFYKLSST